MEQDELGLTVWRLHSGGSAVRPAERSLAGTAHRGGMKFCGPFTNANKSGWWVSSPVDLDITWRGGSDFEWTLHGDYPDTENQLLRFLMLGEQDVHPGRWLPRSKFSWGMVEAGVVQIWTGCIFSTPPGWGLQVRSPVNTDRQPYSVMEAVLETDWLHTDIWLNVVFHEKDVPVQLRRESWPPLAQLLPVRREAYDERWSLQERTLDRSTPEGEKVFKFFVDYQERKFAGEGKQPVYRDDPTVTKDSTTYYRMRKEALEAQLAELEAEAARAEQEAPGSAGGRGGAGEQAVGCPYSPGA
ncbi:DUF6065 family protein [Motilibacter deserti]|uniref:Uncharacterized protein n=1 Tax=Motilibacter deserti TaxID=2714956 RepID=A0ABX0GSG8_9ACTN|nr:DUF6065 family protein [Motilibacter deserti]NHC13041.1 hypothetical protein [Motilibacter deserti]